MKLIFAALLGLTLTSQFAKSDCLPTDASGKQSINPLQITVLPSGEGSAFSGHYDLFIHKASGELVEMRPISAPRYSLEQIQTLIQNAVNEGSMISFDFVTKYTINEITPAHSPIPQSCR